MLYIVTFTGWKGSNEMVVDMAAPEKQGMEVLLDHE